MSNKATAMSSPIFDATFGTGRFKREEPMTTDQSQSNPEPKQDVREALELQLFDLVELARDTRSDKGGEAKWVHPRGALVEEFAKRIAALAQSDAGPKGIDLDDADRAYDKWAEHRNGQSRLDAFRAGVEFGLRHTAPSRPDASGLIEAADLSDVGLFPYQDQDEHTVVLYFNTNEAATRYGEYLKELLRPPPPGCR